MSIAIIPLMPPWNDWYHCICNTYGIWLPGDPRGWRTRHHRQHIDSTLGICEQTLRRSQALLKRDPIWLTQEQRQLALDVIVETLQSRQIEMIALCLDDHHVHLLARFRDHNPRKWVGIAKKRAARALSEAALADEGGVWGKRSQCQPIKDRAHQVATFRYILNHSRHGAATWRIPAGSAITAGNPKKTTHC